MKTGTCSVCQRDEKIIYCCEFCEVDFCILCFIAHFERDHEAITIKTDY